MGRDEGLPQSSDSLLRPPCWALKETRTMDRVVASTPQALTDTLFCALELSKNTWLLGIQFPDREQPSVYPIKGGDSDGLMAKLLMATDRCAKISGKKPSILICYEAGYDAFWLADQREDGARQPHQGPAVYPRRTRHQCQKRASKLYRLTSW